MADNKPVTPISRSKLMASLTPKQRMMTVSVHRKFVIFVKRTIDEILVIGKELQGIKDGMDHGKWLQWVMVSPSFSAGTAENFMNVYKLSRENKQAFQKFRGLGQTKMYSLARLPDAAIKEVTRRQQYKVPGTDTVKRWEQMNEIEWNRSLSDFKDKPEFNADREVQKMFSVLRKLVRNAKGCLRHKGDVEEDNAVKAEKLATEFILEVRKLR